MAAPQRRARSLEPCSTFAAPLHDSVLERAEGELRDGVDVTGQRMIGQVWAILLGARIGQWPPHITMASVTTALRGWAEHCQHSPLGPGNARVRHHSADPVTEDSSSCASSLTVEQARPARTHVTAPSLLAGSSGSTAPSTGQRARRQLFGGAVQLAPSSSGSGSGAAGTTTPKRTAPSAGVKVGSGGPASCTRSRAAKVCVSRAMPSARARSGGTSNADLERVRRPESGSAARSGTRCTPEAHPACAEAAHARAVAAPDDSAASSNVFIVTPELIGSTADVPIARSGASPMSETPSASGEPASHGTAVVPAPSSSDAAASASTPAASASGHAASVMPVNITILNDMVSDLADAEALLLKPITMRHRDPGTRRKTPHALALLYEEGAQSNAADLTVDGRPVTKLILEWEAALGREREESNHHLRRALMNGGTHRSPYKAAHFDVKKILKAAARPTADGERLHRWEALFSIFCSDEIDKPLPGERSMVNVAYYVISAYKSPRKETTSMALDPLCAIVHMCWEDAVFLQERVEEVDDQQGG